MLDQRSLERQLDHERRLSELRKIKLEKIERLEQERMERERLPHRYLHKKYKFQVEFESEVEHKYQVIVAANQVSKGLLDAELVPTPSGFRRVDAIKIGDKIFGDDGKPCRVIAIPFIGEDECYELTFVDGTSLITTKDHMWRCKGELQRFTRYYRGKKHYPTDYGQWVERSTLEMYERGFYAKKNKPINRFVVPYTGPVQYPHKSGLFDCYALGLILGDGTVHSSIGARLWKNDVEILGYLMKAFGGKYFKKKGSDKDKGLGISFPLSGFPLELVKKRSWEKFIPHKYLTASIDQRIALLRGLMDTDGTCNPEGDVTSYTSTSEQLANDVRELVFSLGGSSKIKCRKTHYIKEGKRFPCRDAYTVSIKMPPTINPFLLKRKAKRWRGNLRYEHERTIYSIKPVGVRGGRCFTVDSPNACFVAGKNYVVSHNSTTVIQRNIELATNQKLWPIYWPEASEKNMVPGQFWYFYPTQEVATVEFEEKWRPLMPKGYENSDDPTYGWRRGLGKGGYIRSINFNSGVTIYFKSYKQSAEDLQTGSCYLITCDEECPVHLLSEIQMRVNATGGYIFFVFTATLGQQFWKEVVEDRKQWLKEARIWQVSLYDCQKYVDGTPSKWTNKRIQDTIDKCISQSEVLRRVFGRFVKDEGLQFPTFDRERDLIPYFEVPKNWLVYAGIDYGSGGIKGHPSAIVFLGVNPEKTHAVVMRAWRGDGQVTTCRDVVQVYGEMAKTVDHVDMIKYDYSARDLGTFATEAGYPFQRADKSRDGGIQLISTLFKTGRLKIMAHGDTTVLDEYVAGHKLADELGSLSADANKKNARDDLADATRYAINAVGFDWQLIEQNGNNMTGEGVSKTDVHKVYTIDEERRLADQMIAERALQDSDISGELTFWANQFDQT